jgi:methylated-DNA-[protein]-cysteine S-methyltransferase
MRLLALKKGEKNMYCSTYESPFGLITLGSDGESLTGLWIKAQKYHPDVNDMGESNNLPVFNIAKKWLDSYFAGEKPPISSLRLAPTGSDFRKEVWRILTEIPYGTVVTYGDIGKKAAVALGKTSMSGQAIGGAVGHNPISIVIPCHRVVGSNGSLTGYAGGLDMKIKLLELEGADMSKLFRPKKGTAL